MEDSSSASQQEQRLPPSEQPEVAGPSSTLHIAERKHRRRHIWIGGALAVALCIVQFLQPDYSTVTVSSGRRYDILSVGQDRGIGALFGEAGRSLGPATVVNYYAPTDSAATAETIGREVIDLLNVAVPVARQAGDSLIVLQRTVPVGARWTHFAHGTFMPIRLRSDGDWVPLRRGPSR